MHNITPAGRVRRRLACRAAAIIALSTICAAAAPAAACYKPSAPWGSPPSPPRCTNDICESWTVDGYRRSVEDYIDSLSRYVEKAVAYAECRQDEAVDEWNDFASRTKVRR